MILVEQNKNAFKTDGKEDFRISESLRLTEVKESPLLLSMRAELISRFKSINIESSFILCLNFDQVQNLLKATPEKLDFLDGL